MRLNSLVCAIPGRIMSFLSPKGSLSITINTVIKHFIQFWERGGLVVECQTPKREVLSSIPTEATVLCHLARYTYSL